MPNAPPVLLRDAIEKLEQLATALAEEPDTRGKELLLGIRVLLPKLRTARPATPTMPATPAMRYRGCPSCED